NSPSPAAYYTLSLHDALPILSALHQQVAALECPGLGDPVAQGQAAQPVHDREDARLLDVHALPAGLHPAEKAQPGVEMQRGPGQDRKSTRLNSSHVKISYAVF